jgi:hypothetical protein
MRAKAETTATVLRRLRRVAKRAHRRRKRLLDLGQPAEIAFSPQLELSIRRAGPQPVVVAAVILPGSGALSQFLAKLGSFLVLGLPTNQPRPFGQQRFVDDLDVADGLMLVLSHLIGGEEPGVDELCEDLPSRITSGIRSTPMRSTDPCTHLIPHQRVEIGLVSMRSVRQ